MTIHINYFAQGPTSLDQEEWLNEDTPPIQIAISKNELAALEDENVDVLQYIIKTKVHPAFISFIKSQGISCMCVSCRKRTATAMVNTISLHRGQNSPHQIHLIDQTPFAICENSDECNQIATRRANAFRMDVLSNLQGVMPNTEITKSEICDNGKCGTYTCVKTHGRMKRCSRCKAKKYCSRECQIQHWRDRHKSQCIPVTDS